MGGHRCFVWSRVSVLKGSGGGVVGKQKSRGVGCKRDGALGQFVAVESKSD
jgi:hypothetical protein